MAVKITLGLPMKLFEKKSSTDRLKTTLAQLQPRAVALADKRAIAEAALGEATAARQAHRLDGDLTDEKLDVRLQANVDLCRSKLTGLDADIATLQTKITEAEQQLADEQATASRRAASEKLRRDLDIVEATTLPNLLKSAREFAASLEAFHFHYEATELSRFIGNCASQAEIAAAFSLQELRGMTKQIANGSAPIPAPKPEAAPIAVPEPTPPTTAVFMLRSAHYRDHDGRKHFGGQYTDAIMPAPVAQKAMRLGLAVPVTDARRATLLGSRGGDYRSDAVDVVDIDEAVEHSGVPYIGPDNVIQQANFIERRGPERRGTIEVQRVL